jgi:DNA polymerase-3 subunit gamma/tau
MTLLRMLAFATEPLAKAGEENPTTRQSPNARVGGARETASNTAANYAVENKPASTGAPLRPKVPEAPISTRTLPEQYHGGGGEVAPARLASFDGNWPAFVSSLNLVGLAGMLAKQCEFKSFNNGVVELVLPSTHRHLADKSYQEKLKSELIPRLGTNIRLNIVIGGVAGTSLAAHEDRERSQQQKAAEAAIDGDPFIKNLKQDFGAEVLRSSIRPANT